jgi:Transcriptional Coactivator p15 (PC4)
MTDDAPVEIVVAELSRNAREVVRVTLSEFRGTPTFAIWCYYRDAAGQPRPGKGGIVLGIHHLPALASALARAVDAARTAGRLPAE